MSALDLIASWHKEIPDGFRDDDGAWHDGPHQIAFDAALKALQRVNDAAWDVVDKLNPNVPWSPEALELQHALVAVSALAATEPGEPDA